VKSYLKLLESNFKELLRDRVEIIWTIVFPLVVLFVFGFVSGSDGFSGKISIVVAITIMQLNINAGVRLLSLKDTGALKTLGATPLRRSTFLASEATYRMLITLVQCIVLMIAGMVSFGVTVEGNPLVLASSVVLGSFVFFTVGYALTAILPSAPVAGNVFMLLTFLFIIFSGLFFPLASLPDWLSSVLEYLPLNQNEVAMRTTILGGPLFDDTMIKALVSQLAYLGIFGFLATRFKWS